MRRISLAIVLLPLAAMLASGIIACVMATQCDLGTSIAGAVLPVGGLIALFPLQCLLAVPVYVFCLRFGLLRWWQHVVAGSAVGILGQLPRVLPVLWDDRLRVGFRAERVEELIVLGLAFGLLALVFWIATLWKNPAFAKVPTANTASPGSDASSAA